MSLLQSPTLSNYMVHQIYLDPKSHLLNILNNDYLIYVRVCLEEEHIQHSNCDGSVTLLIFMLELLHDGTLSNPLSNPAFLSSTEHVHRITCQSVVRHFLTIRVIYPSTHKFKQDCMLFILL